jgi:hypothetical protein
MNALAETFRFGRDVIREFTWHTLLLIQVLAVAAHLIVATVFSQSLTVMLEARFVIAEIVGFSIVLAMMIGDQAAARGMRPLLAYALPLAAMSIVGGLVQFELRVWLGIFKTNSESADVGEQIATMVYVASDILSYGVLFELIYLDHRRALRLMRRVAVEEFERARSEQQAADSQLAALQAEIDPVEVIGRLEMLRQTYEYDAPRAEQLLDEFTADLRAKLAPGAGNVYA